MMSRDSVEEIGVSVAARSKKTFRARPGRVVIVSVTTGAPSLPSRPTISRARRVVGTTRAIAERVAGGGSPEFGYERIKTFSGQVAVQDGGGQPVTSPDGRMGAREG